MAWYELSAEIFPEDHPDIGGWTFKRVFEERGEFVKYVMIMYDVTGTYSYFQNYCKGRLKDEQVTQELEDPSEI